MTTLLAVPNVSEGRDQAVLGAIGAAFQSYGTRLLDVHADPDHHRAVFTLAGGPGTLHRAVVEGAREAVARIDLNRHVGVHPRVGAVDVAPIVHLTDRERGAATAEALLLADALGEALELPVYLYGALAGGRTRAQLRRPGALDHIPPDYGPPRPHPTAGATLVAARPPLVAFNVELRPPATLDQAQAIAAAIRETGPEGLPGLRALGLRLETSGIVQVSTNIEDHRATTAADVVEAVSRHAPVAGVELVGLAPRAALAGLPEALWAPGRGAVEDALER